MLDLDVGVKPEMVATDNASYSGMVFGLLTMPGYNFLSRFKDLNDQRFWRAQMPGCGDRWLWTARGLARNEVNLNKVTTHWPDMLRTPGSLVTGRIRAHNLLRGFDRVTRRAPLGQAFTEYGRIAKTLNLRPDHAGIGRYGSHAQILSRSLSVRH
ncbi:Tn3 family transposase [Streptomyces sp. NPDC057746]|uniref:Tn3 family transposase n=1 Tax=Streptomyces sp. NPDC057746 TaxID=3346237 RepID=UPI0036BDFA1C